MATTCILATEISVAFEHFPPLFSHLTLNLSTEPVALIGRNGVGKSILAECLAGLRQPDTGLVHQPVPVRYLAQSAADRPDPRSVAEYLGVAAPLVALDRLLAGNGEVDDLACLADRWSLRSDLEAQLTAYDLPVEALEQPVDQLSGGQRTRLQLLHCAQAVDTYLILDEPTNHLDRAGRGWLGQWLRARVQGTLVITHDRELLQQFDHIIELRDGELHHYGQGFAHYQATRSQEVDKAEADVHHARATLQKERQQQQIEREQHEQRRKQGRLKRRKGDMPKVLLDAQKARSEATGGRVQQKQESAIAQEQARLVKARARLDTAATLAFPLTPPETRSGCLVALEGVRLPWLTSMPPLSWQVMAGQRWLLEGANGSGKSTLLKLLCGRTKALAGRFNRRGRVVLLDQHLALFNSKVSALDNFRRLNPGWTEAEYRDRLALVRLRGARALLPVGVLSGGERLKAALASVLMGPKAVDLVLLDEPDNHLDLESQDLLSRVLSDYRGALVVVTHSAAMAQALQVTDRLHLSR